MLSILALTAIFPRPPCDEWFRKIEPFKKIANKFQLLTIITRSSTLSIVPESIPDYKFVWELLYYKQNQQCTLVQGKN